MMITGCRGQVGHCLVSQLTGKAELLALDFQQLDITNQHAVNDTVESFNPDYIVNAAAHTAVDKAEEEVDASYAVNCDGPRFLAEAASKYNAVMMHISTDYVFDGEGDNAYCESDLTAPIGIYGKSKLAGEEAVAHACERHIILRTAWVFGQHGNNFVKTMLRLGSERDKLSIVGDQFGGPTYAGDIASALIRIMDQVELRKDIEWGVYHFSGMPYVSWYEFAQEIFSVAEKQGVLKSPVLSSIPTSAYPTPAKRPANSRLDCRKIEQVFNVLPSNWKEALKQIEEYRI
ncbi:dTDP-4-dehydrorhamnose reductase [Vibrio sinaloensis]|uniref:dTDP-4-dehydrorhamnose reductase n=1 Tax=Photobacterium sp. (strain ATCC 43367) TaxID=379097 RepID=UPI0022B05916|nr:dTDP-4-dehydrorhamnose reductase [Vibrio sinaloensis]MCZ4294798.1 dTDP-4-dehydrorhamnose reductase [Vibrio sinaloensis]